jgi:hypothetical protein
MKNKYLRGIEGKMKATKFSQYLQSREELKFVDTPHWIYVIEAAIFSVIILVGTFWVSALIAGNYLTTPSEGGLDTILMAVAGWGTLFLEWGAIIFVLFYFINRVIFYLCTYIFASDRRLYVKTGLVRVLVRELSFDDIRATDINYGLLGRFLGYGKLLMDARFVDDFKIPYTHKPEFFAKLIHFDNDLAGDVNLSFALQGLKKDNASESDIPKSSNHVNDVPSRSQQSEEYQNIEKEKKKNQQKNESDLDIGYLQTSDLTAQKDFEDPAEYEGTSSAYKAGDMPDDPKDKDESDVKKKKNNSNMAGAQDSSGFKV